MNNETTTIILACLGFIPWHISRRIVRSRRKGRAYVVRYQVYAPFWRLVIEQPRGGRNTWRWSAPLLFRLADAMQAALRRLLS